MIFVNNKERILTRDTVLVMLATILFQFSMMAINPIINGYAKHLGASSSIAGLIVGVMSIVSIISRPVAGNLTDRISKYALTSVGGILSLIGILGYIFTPNAKLLFVFRIINGMGFVLCTVCMATWLSFLVPRSRVGEAMGYYGLLNAASMAIAPFISVNLYPMIGYKATLGLSALATVLMVITIQFIRNHAQPVKSKHSSAEFKIVQKDVLPVAAIMCFLSIPYFATQADIVSYVAERHLHVNVAMFFLIYAVVLFIARISMKNLFDVVAYGKWFWGCTIAMALCLFFLSIMNNDWKMFLAASMMALGFGLLFSVSQSTSLLLAPMFEQGLANSTFYLGLDIGMATGPMLGGIMTEYLPLNLYYPIMLILLPVAITLYLKHKDKLNQAIDEH